MKTEKEFIEYALENECSGAAHGLIELFGGWADFEETAREIVEYGCENTTDLIGKKAIDFYLRHATEIERYLENREYYEMTKVVPAMNLMENSVWAFVTWLCAEAMGEGIE